MSIKSNLSYLNYLKESGISTFLQNSPNIRYKQNETNQKLSPINLSDVNSLAKLEEYIKQSNDCLLKKTASKTVFGDGNSSSKIMLIGEAPGAEEDKIGKPFVGLAGKLLDKMLASINLNRNNVYITNIIPWRPPNNRTPDSDEILQCLPFIQKHIEIIHPKIIILLGSTAAKAILATTLGIMKIRGKWYTYNNLNVDNPITVRAIYHPAFLLRSPKNKRETWDDLKEIQKKINNLDEKI
tara:strand:- start:462 stop:1181 length:720 start_codon:yes stop_codon:yes gene_type:complete